MIKEEIWCRYNPKVEEILRKVRDEKYKESGKKKPLDIWLQMTFESKRGIISLIHLGFNDIYDGYRWEIYCTKGNLFVDVKRFRSLNEAIKKIEGYLRVRK